MLAEEGDILVERRSSIARAFIADRVQINGTWSCDFVSVALTGGQLPHARRCFQWRLGYNLGSRWFKSGSAGGHVLLWQRLVLFLF
jgi:hypothetical protein